MNTHSPISELTQQESNSLDILIIGDESDAFSVLKWALRKANPALEIKKTGISRLNEYENEIKGQTGEYPKLIVLYLDGNAQSQALTLKRLKQIYRSKPIKVVVCSPLLTALKLKLLFLVPGILYYRKPTNLVEARKFARITKKLLS